MSNVPWAGEPGSSIASPARFLALTHTSTVPDPCVRRLGRTVTEFRDNHVEAVIGTRYSSLHPDRDWIVVDLRVRALGPAPVEISRRDISLTRPDGSKLGLPGREEVSDEISNIGRAMIAASAVEDSLDEYLPRSHPLDLIPFVTRSMLESVVLEAGRVASGKLLFRVPRGTRIPSQYTFGVSTGDLDVRIPFRLPASDFPEPGAGRAGR
jgi:hypothetical protein